MRRKAVSSEFLPMAELEKLPGWATKLTPAEQQEVVTISKDLGEAFIAIGHGRTTVGELLAKAQSILEPKRMFRPWCARIPFGLPIRTVYRYITLYHETGRALPAPYLRVGLMLNLDKLDLPKVRVIPPPKTTDPAKIKEYLESVQVKRTAAVESDPDVLARIVVNSGRVCYDKLPAEWKGKQKIQWMESVCGKLLSIPGISQARTIAPEAIPIDWVKHKKAS